MKEVIEVNNRFYILAGSSPEDDRAFVLKSGDMFALVDHYGNIRQYGLGEQGIFYEGTRFLSHFDLRIEQHRPLFLSSATSTRNEILTIDLSNPDLQNGKNLLIPRGTIHISRFMFLWDGKCHQSLEISNFGMREIECELTLRFDADFADIFEVRGTKRERKGSRSGPFSEDGSLWFSYEGLDGVVRKTRVSFKPSPSNLRDYLAHFSLHLGPRASQRIYIAIECELDGSEQRPVSYEEALLALSHEVAQLRADTAEIDSSSRLFNNSLERGLADVCMMITHTPHGLYPYGGVPWFSVPFGRDGIITALQMLWVNPSIARGVLSFLAATQAKVSDRSAESDPGKIIHEMRRGEMAATAEIPFRQYYGSVDATPLFVMLAGAYYDRTGDRTFIETIWPNIVAALEWIDRYGDVDGDGFVEYSRYSKRGLLHQGWKDSEDSVFHSDGRLADAPIALCEVQGYTYAAKRSAARLCAVLGDKSRSAELQQQALELQDRFDRSFWSDARATYALALDRNKQPCEVRSSNPGHCLYTRIAKSERANQIMRTLTSETSFSGWGIRTLDSTEIRYNPMSYHNGSVWPHDNAIIAFGLGLYGFKQEVLKLFSALFDLSQNVRLNRIPELICGFPKLERQGPTLYPVACAPQAWSAGSIYMMIQACLGLHIDSPSHSVRFEHPTLPEFIEKLHIRNLRVGETLVDLSLHRYHGNVGVNIEKRTGPLDIVILT